MDTKTPESIISDRKYRYSAADAEALGGITVLQVSKWRRRLNEPEKYRAMLFGAAYAKAMLLIGNIAILSPAPDSPVAALGSRQAVGRQREAEAGAK